MTITVTMTMAADACFVLEQAVFIFSRKQSFRTGLGVLFTLNIILIEFKVGFNFSFKMQSILIFLTSVCPSTSYM